MLKEHPSRPPAVSKRKTTAVEEKSTANAAKLAATSNSAASSDRKQWTLRSTPNVKTKQIRPLSATSRTLNDNNKRAAVDGKNNKRPATVYGDNVTVRRTPHHHHHNPKSSGEELSRASSTSTLNAAATATSTATASKPKKVKDIDDKSAVETLRRELSEMAEARDLVALKLSSKCAELAALEAEIARLRAGREETVGRVEQLAEENTVLRNRLRDVAHSPLSDNEKQQLLFDNHHHGYGGGSGGNGGQQLQSSSAPASIATNLPDDGGGDHTACPTPEWDKQSSGNVSEVSVACLQDKINQMQETHYSTNEELQATLQELTDLQRQLYEHQQENVRLNDEKNLMFESLCRQTERLNDTRDEVESLKQLLYRHGNQHASDHHDEHNLESGHSASDQSAAAAEREQKLVDLVRAAQEERESLLVHQDQLQQDVVQTRGLNAAQQEEIGELRERVQTLESTLDAKHAEHKLLDRELALARDQSSGRQIEINRLKDVLESARTKINELEQDRTLADKSELDELLDNVRKEKDSLEADVTDLKEQLALSRNDNEKLREQIFALQEECKVVRNNARTTQCDLEYKLDRLLNEKAALQQQVDALEEAVDGLRAQTQCQQEDKRQLSSVLAETQRHLNESEARVAEVEAELDEMRRLKDEQEEEWEKFQRDLLTSVRVANDFKTEAQQDVQKLIMENKAGRERIKQLETQLEKLKESREGQSESNLDQSPLRLNESEPHLKSGQSESSLGQAESKSGQLESKSQGKHQKRSSLTKNEAHLMGILLNRYRQIDPNLTDDQLSAEQKVIRQLMRSYEPEKGKPVARKPKNELAISKPLLDSVCSNPKLEAIVHDRTLPTLLDSAEGMLEGVGIEEVGGDPVEEEGFDYVVLLENPADLHGDQSPKFRGSERKSPKYSDSGNKSPDAIQSSSRFYVTNSGHFDDTAGNSPNSHGEPSSSRFYVRDSGNSDHPLENARNSGMGQAIRPYISANFRDRSSISESGIATSPNSGIRGPQSPNLHGPSNSSRVCQQPLDNSDHPAGKSPNEELAVAIIAASLAPFQEKSRNFHETRSFSESGVAGSPNSGITGAKSLDHELAFRKSPNTSLSSSTSDLSDRSFGKSPNFDDVSFGKSPNSDVSFGKSANSHSYGKSRDSSKFVEARSPNFELSLGKSANSPASFGENSPNLVRRRRFLPNSVVRRGGGASKKLFVKSKSMSDLNDVSNDVTSASSAPPSCAPLKRHTGEVNLDAICARIDPETPEHLLDHEQRFALRLRQTFSSGEKSSWPLNGNNIVNKRREPKLRKCKIDRSTVTISGPTRESVQRNPVLAKLLAQTDTSSVVTSSDSTRSSYSSSRKSVEDINFAFYSDGLDETFDRHFDVYGRKIDVSDRETDVSGSRVDVSGSRSDVNDKRIDVYGKLVDSCSYDFDVFVGNVVPPAQFRDSDRTSDEEKDEKEDNLLNLTTFRPRKREEPEGGNPDDEERHTLSITVTFNDAFEDETEDNEDEREESHETKRQTDESLGKMEENFLENEENPKKNEDQDQRIEERVRRNEETGQKTKGNAENNEARLENSEDTSEECEEIHPKAEQTDENHTVTEDKLVTSEEIAQRLLKQDEAHEAFVYNLDEDDILARRSAKRRFSHVVDEIKGKFDQNEEMTDDSCLTMAKRRQSRELSAIKLSDVMTGDEMTQINDEQTPPPPNSEESPDNLQFWSNDKQYNALNEEEKAVVTKARRKQATSRPVSEFNDDDLMIIEGLKQVYLVDDDEEEATSDDLKKNDTIIRNSDDQTDFQSQQVTADSSSQDLTGRVKVEDPDDGEERGRYLDVLDQSRELLGEEIEDSAKKNEDSLKKHEDYAKDNEESSKKHEDSMKENDDALQKTEDSLRKDYFMKDKTEDTSTKKHEEIEDSACSLTPLQSRVEYVAVKDYDQDNTVIEESEEIEEEPRVLSPTALYSPPAYEPVYANYDMIRNFARRSWHAPESYSVKKDSDLGVKKRPLATPRHESGVAKVVGLKEKEEEATRMEERPVKSEENWQMNREETEVVGSEEKEEVKRHQLIEESGGDVTEETSKREETYKGNNEEKEESPEVLKEEEKSHPVTEESRSEVAEETSKREETYKGNNEENEELPKVLKEEAKSHRMTEESRSDVTEDTSKREETYKGNNEENEELPKALKEEVKSHRMSEESRREVAGKTTKHEETYKGESEEVAKSSQTEESHQLVIEAKEESKAASKLVQHEAKEERNDKLIDKALSEEAKIEESRQGKIEAIQATKDSIKNQGTRHVRYEAKEEGKSEFNEEASSKAREAAKSEESHRVQIEATEETKDSKVKESKEVQNEATEEMKRSSIKDEGSKQVTDEAKEETKRNLVDEALCEEMKTAAKITEEGRQVKNVQIEETESSKKKETAEPIASKLEEMSDVKTRPESDEAASKIEETGAKQLYEEFGGQVKKSFFSIAYKPARRQPSFHQKQSTLERQSVKDLRKKFESGGAT